MTYRGAISSLKVEKGVLFVPHIADSLKEKQREALCLPISPICSGAAQRVNNRRLGLNALTIGVSNSNGCRGVVARPERIEPYIKPSFQAVKRGLNTPFRPSFGPRFVAAPQ